MTPQEKLDFVKQKIIEAVPEIMELKFGCYVKINRYLKNTTRIIDRIGWTDVIRVDGFGEWFRS